MHLAITKTCALTNYKLYKPSPIKDTSCDNKTFVWINLKDFNVDVRSNF